MKISLIIPTYNKADYLDIVLYSINQTVKIYPIEIIIIDDGSSDHTKNVVNKYLNFLDIKYFYQKNKGLSNARNRGIIKAKYDKLLFIDDDRILPKDYFEKIDINDSRTVVIGKRQEIYISNFNENINFIKKKISLEPEYIEKISLSERYYNKTKAIYSMKKNSIPWVGCTFANTLMDKFLFDIIGLFDERFIGWGFEDLELAYRLHKENINFVLNQNMYTTHIYHGHDKSIFEQRKKNYSLFCLIHPENSVKFYDEFAKNKISVKKYNEVVLKAIDYDEYISLDINEDN